MLPRLSRDIVASPELPEKAVQFGTGAFLRGFVDYFLDQANRTGHFGGRVAMIGSTGSGRDRVLSEQDGLYTLDIQGVKDGAVVRERRVISSVSRAVSATTEWPTVLEIARNPELELIFSNTTEVGIVLDEADVDAEASPPRSFPGKLTRFLYERFRSLPDSEVTVIPCELIEGNGDRLKQIVLTLADRWQLGPAFSAWVAERVPFANTLVDRIVPGTPDAGRLAALEQEAGYADALYTTCEVYSLFAIQGASPAFAAADPGVVLTDDVTPYRERKVRLLNGTHTAMVPVALLCGLEIVQEAVEDADVGAFIRRVMFDEIVPTLEAEGAESFARDVFDRFSNPFIRHALFDITLQGTMKTRVRNVPTIARYAAKFGGPPPSLAFALAAFLVFMKGELHEAARARGVRVPLDDGGARIQALWTAHAGDHAALTRAFLADDALWQADLTVVPGLVDAVTSDVARIEAEGARAALQHHLSATSASTPANTAVKSIAEP